MFAPTATYATCSVAAAARFIHSFCLATVQHVHINLVSKRLVFYLSAARPVIQCSTDNKAYLGSSFNISCDVQFRSFGPSNAQYLRNNRRVEDDARHELIQKNSRLYLMVIKNVTFDDAGVWEIKATQWPKEKSEFIILDVGK